MRPEQKHACLALAAKAKKGELTAKDVPLAGTIIEQLVDAVERAEMSTRDVFAGDAVMGLASYCVRGHEHEMNAEVVASIGFDIADACMAERERRRAETKGPEKSEVGDGK